MNHRLLFLSLSLFSTLVSAQVAPPDDSVPVLTRELLPIWQQHAVVVDGATNPQGIPYGYAMERAFWRFTDERALGEERFRQQLRTAIPVTDADAQRIGDIALQSDSVSAGARNESSVKTDNLCAELVSGQPRTVDAVDFAMRLSAIETNEADRLTAYYKEAVGSLSPSTRSALEAYVDANIRQTMTWGHDLVGLANEVPNAFLAHWKLVCERQLRKSPSEKTWKHTVSTMTIQPSN